jgi:hypothetical protein
LGSLEGGIEKGSTNTRLKAFDLLAGFTDGTTNNSKPLKPFFTAEVAEVAEDGNV